MTFSVNLVFHVLFEIECVQDLPIFLFCLFVVCCTISINVPLGFLRLRVDARLIEDGGRPKTSYDQSQLNQESG